MIFSQPVVHTAGVGSISLPVPVCVPRPLIIHASEIRLLKRQPYRKKSTSNATNPGPWTVGWPVDFELRREVSRSDADCLVVHYWESALTGVRCAFALQLPFEGWTSGSGDKAVHDFRLLLLEGHRLESRKLVATEGQYRSFVRRSTSWIATGGYRSQILGSC